MHTGFSSGLCISASHEYDTESEKSCMFQDFFERSEWEKDTEFVIQRTIGGQAREVPLCPRRCCSQSFVIKRIPYQSDFWQAYQTVIPSEQHHAVGKETEETAHIERFNNTLKQRLGRFVRKTPSFSKCE